MVAMVLDVVEISGAHIVGEGVMAMVGEVMAQTRLSSGIPTIF